MSAGNPSGPVVVAGGQVTEPVASSQAAEPVAGDETEPKTAEAVAWDLAHLVANGVPVAVVCDPGSALADALATVGVASQYCDPPVDDGPPAGVVAIYPADEADPAAVAADLGATLVSLAGADGDGGECVPGGSSDASDSIPPRQVVADAGLKNPVLGVLGGASADGGHVEVAP